MIPYTDYEKLALLNEIECGDKVVIPANEEHARFMIRVAQHYLDQCHQETVDMLKKNYE